MNSSSLLSDFLLLPGYHFFPASLLARTLQPRIPVYSGLSTLRRASVIIWLILTWFLFRETVKLSVCLGKRPLSVIAVSCVALCTAPLPTPLARAMASHFPKKMESHRGSIPKFPPWNSRWNRLSYLPTYSYFPPFLLFFFSCPLSPPAPHPIQSPNRLNHQEDVSSYCL